MIADVAPVEIEIALKSARRGLDFDVDGWHRGVILEGHFGQVAHDLGRDDQSDARSKADDCRAGVAVTLADDQAQAGEPGHNVFIVWRILMVRGACHGPAVAVSRL